MRSFNTDVIMTNVYLHLARDLSLNTSKDILLMASEAMISGGIRKLRSLNWPPHQKIHDTYLYKIQYQMESFFKRYRFRDDMFTSTELDRASIQKFEDDQIRIRKSLTVTPVVERVLEEARRILTNALGRYDLEEHIELCAFGRRACVGHPYKKSFLDRKFLGPLTGSLEHIAFFKEALKRDPILQDAIHKCSPHGDPMYQLCQTLSLSLVPKSYKARRCILANTLLGSFYTTGLGKVFQDRLLGLGLDIRFLQQKHGYLAKKSSISRSLVTADLSSASDSITLELLKRILPPDWYTAVVYGRIDQVVLPDKRTIQMSSVITMGLGHTFPLQTLVFYSLLRAIANLLKKPAYISVYGDDLIYSHHLHKYVSAVFPHLHLKLNMDKTYVEDFFRESCGSDYYRGSDVRPFSLEGEYQLLRGRRASCFLYKILNGLLHRWDEVEIPLTVNYLLSTLLGLDGIVLQVPPSFPVTSGYRVSIPRKDLSFAKVTYNIQTGLFRFKYLHTSTKDRPVLEQYPYYWEKLRCSVNNEVSEPWDDELDEPILKWVRTSYPLKNYRSKITGRRLHKLIACTKDKGLPAPSRQTGLTSSWT
jgi:hypothetical protein